MLWHTCLSRAKSVHCVQSVHSQAVNEILASLRSLEIEVQTDGQFLRWRPADAVGPELKLAIQANKAEVIAALTCPVVWDIARADAALSDCNNLLDHALTDASLTATQRAVAVTLSEVVRTHADQRDPLLWSDQQFLAEQFAGWQRFNAFTALKRRKTA